MDAGPQHSTRVRPARVPPASPQPTAPLVGRGCTVGVPVADAWYGETWHDKPELAWRDTPGSDKVGTS